MAKVTDLTFSTNRKTKFLDLISAQPTPSKKINLSESLEQTQHNGTEKDTEKEPNANKKGTKKVQHTDQKDTHSPKKEYSPTPKEIQRSKNKDTEQGTNNFPTLPLENLQLDELTIQNEIYALHGIKEKILFFIVDLCSSKGSLITPPLSVPLIASKLNEKRNSIKVAIQRLKKTALISVASSKRSQYTCFRIAEIVKHFVLEKRTNYNMVLNLSPPYNAFEKGTLGDTDKGTTPHVVSSSYNNTTNYGKRHNNIDCSPLSDIGFSEAHLIQIFREYQKKPDSSLSEEIIQDSIYALAFDLKYNDVVKDFKKSPAVVLLSLLKNGCPYSSQTPEKYMSPKEEAMHAYQEMKKQQQKVRMETEENFKQIEYNDWLSDLKEDELLKLSPEKDLSTVPEKLHKTIRRRNALEFAKDYFEAEIWPQKKTELESQIAE